MNILVDLLILALAGVTIFLAGKRGFIKTAVTAASTNSHQFFRKSRRMVLTFISSK